MKIFFIESESSLLAKRSHEMILIDH